MFALIEQLRILEQQIIYSTSGLTSLKYSKAYAEVKKSLVREPGTSKISIRTSICFHPMSDRQVRKYSARLSFHECPALFGNRTSKNLGVPVLVQRTSELFEKIFYPCYECHCPSRCHNK